MYEAQDDSYTSLAYIASTISCEAATAAAEAAQKTRLLTNKKDQLEREGGKEREEGRIEREIETEDGENVSIFIYKALRMSYKEAYVWGL